MSKPEILTAPIYSIVHSSGSKNKKFNEKTTKVFLFPWLYVFFLDEKIFPFSKTMFKIMSYTFCVRKWPAEFVLNPFCHEQLFNIKCRRTHAAKEIKGFPNLLGKLQKKVIFLMTAACH